jgi:cytochrome c biogenesis protein CcmG/thiol:disulfide interchange protein DsbE
MTSPRRRLLVIGLTLVAVMAACDGGETGAGARSALRVVDVPSLPATIDALPEMDVTAFEALLAELEGTPTVVNVWASWCEPCIREMPRLAEAAERYRDRIQFLGVDVADARDPARRFLHELDVPYPNVFDPSGAIRTSIGGVGQPVTAFIAADGEVEVISGELSERDLADQLARLAA